MLYCFLSPCTSVCINACMCIFTLTDGHTMSLLYFFNLLKALLCAPETPIEVKVKLGAKETAGSAGWEAG